MDIVIKLMAGSVMVYFVAQFISMGNPDKWNESKGLAFITVGSGILLVLSLMLYTCRGG